jgi:hypothetical protein
MKSVLSAGDGQVQAATNGYQRALLVGAFIIVLAATRGRWMAVQHAVRVSALLWRVLRELAPWA